MTGIHGLNRLMIRLCIGLLCTLGFSLLLLACERQPETIKVGMIASLTGRTGDIGLAARDGALLAVEQVNSSGGVQGQPIELLVRDIGNDPDQARLAVKELASLGVFVSVGPVLSSMAIAMEPQADNNDMLLVSPTVTTNQLNDKDDLFIRVISQCSDTSHELANLVFQQQRRRIAVIAEQSNKAYTESWKKCFKNRFEELGGEVMPTVKYDSGKGQGFIALTLEALQTNPDSLLILGNAIDAAMIAQQVKKKRLDLQIFISEWAFTHELMAHGGSSVEGIFLFHNFNSQSQSSLYLNFVKDFEQRFGRKPSFPEVHAYDAARVVLSGLQKGARTGSDLKQEILRVGEFEGLQATLQLNRFGDVKRPLFLTEVRDGEFVVIGEKEPQSGKK